MFRFPLVRGALIALAAAVACAGPDTVASEDTAAAISGDTVIIDGTTPSCGTCTLELTLAAKIGDVNDPEIPQRLPDVLRDSRGTHYLYFDGWVNKPILRYDSLGRFVGKLGRYGQGPGEYTMTMSTFIDAADTLYVWSDGRTQVFDPDGRYARTWSGVMTRSSPFGVSREGELLVYSTRTSGFTAESWKRDILISDSGGAVLDSIDAFTGGWTSYMKAVLGADGSLWTYMDGNYRLERLDRDGRTTKLLGVIAPPHGRPFWVTRPEYDSLMEQSRRVSARVAPLNEPPPRPRLRTRTDMSVDAEGLLWIARTIEAPGSDTLTITPQRLSPDEAPHEVTIPREQEDRMYHTLIEVIDPERAQLLARTQAPFLAVFARPGYLARVTADDDGAYLTEVYRVTLRRQR